MKRNPRFCDTQGTAIRVLPTSEFVPDADAELLHVGLSGTYATGARAVIDVLGHRGLLQRLLIAQKFETKYGSSLISQLQAKLDGSFRDAVLALMTPHGELYAKELHEAMDGLGTEEDTVIEILAPLSNSQFKIVFDAYERSRLFRFYHKKCSSDVT